MKTKHRKIKINAVFFIVLSIQSLHLGAPLTEVLKLKLLRLYLGELGQSYYDARRLNDQSPLEDALKHEFINRSDSAAR